MRLGCGTRLLLTGKYSIFMSVLMLINVCREVKRYIETV